MFDMETILKMAGIPKETFQQLMAVKAHLDRLPSEKQKEVMGRFVKDLQDAVKEVEEE